MLHEMMNFFRITKEFRDVSYFKTDESKKLFKELTTLIGMGNRLIALTGIVGSGKTTMCENIWNEAHKMKKIIISTSWAIETDKTSIKTLERALFADLSPDQKFKVISANEYRERQLCSLIKKKNKPVALFVDEAHKLKANTLLSLKRLLEVNRLWGNKFSVVLIGLPNLATTLKDADYEQIGARVRKINFDPIVNKKREFIQWVISDCTSKKMKPTDLFTEPAINFLTESLRTPLQMIYYSWLSLEVAYEAGMKIVDIETVRKSLAPNIDSLKANLQRQGFSEKLLCEILDLKKSEMRNFFKNKLPENKMHEIHFELLNLGIIQKKTG